MGAEKSKNIEINAGRLKHLEILQQVITRMASNSFLVKGWSITLISALLAFAAKEKIQFMAWVAVLPWLAFWILDGYFLRQERLFRELFDDYRKQPQDIPTDFSMDTRSVSNRVVSQWKAMFSETLRVFHGVLAGIITLILLFSYRGLLG